MSNYKPIMEILLSPPLCVPHLFVGEHTEKGLPRPLAEFPFVAFYKP